jgi:diacylglycerol kinase (ATP)
LVRWIAERTRYPDQVLSPPGFRGNPVCENFAFWFDSAACVEQDDVPVGDLSKLSNELPAIVFVNALAGGGRTGSYLIRIRQVFETRKIQVQFVMTESSEDLQARAMQGIAAGHRVLLAMGGDGTFQGLANAAYGSDVLLGVLPTGGGNDFASALGLPRDPLAAARVVLSGQPRYVDLLRARTGDGCIRLYLAGGGVGLDAEAMAHVSGAFRRMPGRWRYVAAALRALRGFAPLGVRAEFPGSELRAMESKVFLAGVLNTPTYGGGLRFAPGAQIDDGWLTTVFLENLTGFEVLALLPRLLRRGELPSARVRRTQARKVVLTTDRQSFFHGDGEILGPTPVRVEVVPGALRVLAPR